MGLSKTLAITLGILSLTSTAQANNGTILQGVLDLPRADETGPIDGCANIQTGLTIGGGFMLFTCEKLLPYHPISAHEPVAQRYQSQLKQMGWTQAAKMDDGFKFTKRDEFGCTANLSVRVWKDRSMNEAPRPKTARKSHRQIVFTANYNGAACERYYPMVRAMKEQNRMASLALR